MSSNKHDELALILNEALELQAKSIDLLNRISRLLSNELVGGAAPAGRSRMILLADWQKYHPWPGDSALRKLAAQRETNGFSKCCKAIGGRLVIDEAAFFEWAKEKQPARMRRGRKRRVVNSG